MTEFAKSTFYKYLTAFHAVIATILYVFQIYGMPATYEEAAVYVALVTLAALVYRKDKDTKTILEQLNLTPQQEYTIKQTIEFFLSLMGWKATVEKEEEEEVPNLPPIDIKDAVRKELERRGLKIGESNSS